MLYSSMASLKTTCSFQQFRPLLCMHIYKSFHLEKVTGSPRDFALYSVAPNTYGFRSRNFQTLILSPFSNTFNFELEIPVKVWKYHPPHDPQFFEFLMKILQIVTISYFPAQCICIMHIWRTVRTSKSLKIAFILKDDLTSSYLVCGRIFCKM